jgi:hypothetical protein
MALAPRPLFRCWHRVASERFLTGERPEPAFLISKPFQPAMVSAVASQALFFQRNSRNRAPRAAVS